MKTLLILLALFTLGCNEPMVGPNTPAADRAAAAAQNEPRIYGIGGIAIYHDKKTGVTCYSRGLDTLSCVQTSNP